MPRYGLSKLDMPGLFSPGPTAEPDFSAIIKSLILLRVKMPGQEGKFKAKRIKVILLKPWLGWIKYTSGNDPRAAGEKL